MLQRTKNGALQQARDLNDEGAFLKTAKPLFRSFVSASGR